MGFMSSWDRQAVLEQYEARFASCRSEEALIEQLGSPTVVAIELARTYVPSAPPSAVDTLRREALETIAEVRGERLAAAEAMTEEPEETALAWDTAEAEEAPAKPAKKPSRVKAGALIAYLIPAVIIGLPVTVVLVCVGLPFLITGAAAIAAAVLFALRAAAMLSLVSDVLLLLGGALGVGALGLLAAWFGLWLSMELAYVWIARVLVALGEKLCLKKEETV